jgi:O-antigen/teichoic acid export membrane protein
MGTAPESTPDADLHHVARMARGSALLVASGVIGYAGTFALAVLVARVFGKEAFGLWVIAYSIGQLLSIVGQVGADWMVMRQGSFYQGTGDEERLRRTIHVALMIAGAGLSVFSVGLFVLASTVANSIFHAPSLAPMLRLTAVITPIVGIRQVLVYSTQAFKEMKDAALVRNILQPALALVAVGISILVFDQLLLAYAALIASETVLLCITVVVLQRRIRLIGPVAPIEVGKLLRFAVPAWASRLLGQGRAQFMPLLLGSLAAVATSAVYTASNRIAGALTSIVNSLNQVYTAIASDLYLQGRREEFVTTYRSATKWIFTLGAPLLVLILAFPGDLLSIFGRSFREGEVALVILGVGLLFNFSTGPVTVTLIIIGRSTLALVDYIAVIVLEVGLAVWLIPRYGLVGGAIAKAVGVAANNLVPLLQVWMTEHVLPFRMDFWKPAFAAILAAVVARLVVSVAPVGPGVAAAALGGIVISAVYVVTILLLGLSDEDRAALAAVRLRRAGRAPATASTNQWLDP